MKCKVRNELGEVSAQERGENRREGSTPGCAPSPVGCCFLHFYHRYLYEPKGNNLLNILFTVRGRADFFTLRF